MAKKSMVAKQKRKAKFMIHPVLYPDAHTVGENAITAFVASPITNVPIRIHVVHVFFPNK